MAKNSLIQREKRRQRLVQKYTQRRQELTQLLKQATNEERLMYQQKLQALPRDSAPSRLHNRCFLTGRPRAYYRDFGLSRHVIRKMAHEGELPGVTKSSW
uniref:ribosomal protein S14 n=1 Tax=Hormidiella parvula TaxID=2058785 RepID=UPI00286D3573|nr:ribosomal protein S14 [Hormidiella parvula]WKT06015.1 ribosomal protein S14 [Hormidiella parvula]